MTKLPDPAEVTAALVELFEAEAMLHEAASRLEQATRRHETALAACRVALKPSWSKR